MTAIALEGEGEAKELLEKEQKKLEYKAYLAQQIAEKEEKKKFNKQKENEEDIRAMHEFANYYRIGARNQGGGSPIRDRDGNIVAQHAAFSSQSQHNGGIEKYEPPSYGQLQQQNQSNQMQQMDQSVHGLNQNNSLNPYMQVQDQQQDPNLTLNDGVHPFMQGSKTINPSGTYSPGKKEVMHMKPSNAFEDITEDEFNAREQRKHSYQRELFKQMQETSNRKQAEKQRVRDEELRDEQKLMQQLDQLREQFENESQPKSANVQKRQDAPRGGLTRTPDTVISNRSKIQRDQASRVSGDRSGRGSPSLLGQEPPRMPTPNMTTIPNYQQPNPSSMPIYQHPYHSPPVQIYDPPSNPPLSSNHGVNEQLERLKQVQEEIDRKNNEERNEVNKIMKDIMDTSRRYNFGSNHSSPRFGSKKYSELADPYNLSIHQREVSPGNMRHESQFQRLENNSVKMHEMMQGPNLTRNQQLDDLPIGSSAFVVHDGRSQGGQDEMAKLDSLIDDFQKVPGTNE